jgi:hypothetical protein
MTIAGALSFPGPNEQSPVARALQSGGPILNHVAYLVDVLEPELPRPRRAGGVQIGDAKPAMRMR